MSNEHEENILMEEIDFEQEVVEMEVKTDKNEITILSPVDLNIQMSTIILSVQSILPLSHGTIRVLLQKHKWNKDLLLEKAFSEDQIFTESKITVIQDDEDYCNICCSEGAVLFSLGCAHVACSGCWGSYLTENIKNGKSEIQCIGDCERLVGDEDVVRLLEFKDSSILSSYKNLTLKNYVDSSKSMVWCIGPDCQYIIQSENPGPHTVTCSCGTQFCFQCSQGPHDPVSCQNLKMFLKKSLESRPAGGTYTSDHNTNSWILSNTKDCPKCFTAIQKNGGCNMMTCKNPRCRFVFCWLCLKMYSGHGLKPCNGFNIAEEKNRINSRAELLRFNFYFNRFKAHKQSLELEKKLVSTVNTKLEKLQANGMSWTDTRCLSDAVRVLLKCRQTLLFTYPFAYYLERTDHALMFESNQKDLEMATEQLSGFLEQDMEVESLLTLTQKVQDKCRYVEHRRKILLDHCAEGVTVDTVGLVEIKEIKVDVKPYMRVVFEFVLLFVLLVALVLVIVFFLFELVNWLFFKKSV